MTDTEAKFVRMDMYAVGVMAMDLLVYAVKKIPCKKDYSGCFMALIAPLAAKMELMTTPKYFNNILGDDAPPDVINFLECIFWVRPPATALLHHEFFGGEMQSSSVCVSPKPKSWAEAAAGGSGVDAEHATAAGGGKCPVGSCPCPEHATDPAGNPAPPGMTMSWESDCQAFLFTLQGATVWCNHVCSSWRSACVGRIV